ncbi:MAG TPA: sigma 54-interacting transcriptional regulator [Syntrophorhabdaceae bacterium]|jgi:transcriptional regulator with GAF, ATPase, and Fis domain
MDENEFFRKASIHLSSSLDIATALHRCLLFLREHMPVDVMIIWLYEESMGGLRRIAAATPEEGRNSDTIMLLSQDVRERLLRMDVPHAIIERPDLSPVAVRIVNHPDGDPVGRSLRHYFEPPDYSALLMYLSIEGRKMGTLFVRAEGRDRYTEEHARMLAALEEPFALVVSHALLREEGEKLKDQRAEDNRFLHGEIMRMIGDQIVGGDYGLKGVMEMVRQVAHRSSPVLLRGETGAGKDVIAGAIHRFSSFRDGPFIKVNCGAIPESLVDSELFGHEKGAFTGAIAQKRGCFERADKGTIFLDEIGDLPLQSQVRLLRVLQYKEIQRVGGSSPIPVDIRIIAATHRNLEAMVEKEAFREDLWFRLNVFPIFIPPLRRRKADIPALVHHLLAKKARDLKLDTIPVLAPGTIDRLMEYHWPGNVRELENVIERALILGTRDTLTADAFLFREEKPRGASEEGGPMLTLDNAMARHIRNALALSEGKVHGPDGAARLLNVNASTLRNRMDKLGIVYGRAKEK